MDRTELQQELKNLLEEEKREMRINAEKRRAIQLEYDRIVRNAADDVQRKKSLEALRHKEAIKDIEFERQKLYADYNAQKNAKKESNENSND